MTNQLVHPVKHADQSLRCALNRELKAQGFFKQSGLGVNG